MLKCSHKINLAFVTRLCFIMLLVSGCLSGTRAQFTIQSKVEPTHTPLSTPVISVTKSLIVQPTDSPVLEDTPETTIVSTVTSPAAIESAPRPPAPALGTAVQYFATRSGFDKALEIDVRWLRRWYPLSWLAVEGKEGAYRWEALAQLGEELLHARAHNIEPIIEIQWTPYWAQKVPGHSCSAIRADKFDAFAQFMEQVVSRFGTHTPYRVRYWQLGNELDVAPQETSPDSYFGCWGDVNDPYYGGEHYAEMLKVVYPRIKAVDADAQVMLGGLLLECDPYTMTVPETCVSARRLKSGYFLEGVLKNGGGDYFDIADMHTYAEYRPNLPLRMHSYYSWGEEQGGTGVPEKAKFMRDVLARYGHGTKPLVLGEAALKCTQPTPACYEAAAAFIPRAFAEAYALQLHGAVYYPLVANQAYYALLKGDLSSRPMYDAFKFMSSQLSDAQYDQPVADYTGVAGYRFVKEDTSALEIAWSADGEDHMLAPPKDFLAAFDKYGQPMKPVDGQLMVGWSPIYIQFQTPSP